jgi:hypothetical protein
MIPNGEPHPQGGELHHHQWKALFSHHDAILKGIMMSICNFRAQKRKKTRSFERAFLRDILPAIT